MKLTPLILYVLIFGFLAQQTFSLQSQHEKAHKNDRNVHTNILDAEIVNIDSKLTNDTPLVINFDNPHGLLIFKENNHIFVDVNYFSGQANNLKITNQLITKETVAFFFGDSIGQIIIRTNSSSSQLSAVKISFSEDCQKFYLQTKYDDFQVNENVGKTELTSSLSLTEENLLTCYYHDMDFFPYFVTFQFNDDEEFVKINGKVTNSKSGKIIFTEKSVLTFENVYFSENKKDYLDPQATEISKKQINMTIFSHVSNTDNSEISEIMNDIVFYKGYIQNSPGFIKGEISEKKPDDDYFDYDKKKKQTTIIITTVLCIFVFCILCASVSYCVRKRKYCSFKGIEDNNEIDDRKANIVENDASSSVSVNFENGNETLSNDEFEDRNYLQDEFAEGYPQNNFQQSNIEYRVPSQTLLATVLDEANAKL